MTKNVFTRVNTKKNFDKFTKKETKTTKNILNFEILAANSDIQQITKKSCCSVSDVLRIHGSSKNHIKLF